MRPFDEVPLDFDDNIDYRSDILEQAANDVAFQQGLIEACRIDTLYFLGTFCWTLEPRRSLDDEAQYGIIPFIPWPHQIPAVEKMDAAWGVSDLVWDKSRGQGATWLICNRLLKSWLFDLETFHGGIASKSAPDVDTMDNLSTVMPKIDWQIQQLPRWMVPGAKDIRRVYGDEHLLVNRLNGNTIKGFSATDDLGTGGRFTVWLWDEMAKFPAGQDKAAINSTAPTSNSRMMVSTHKGTSNAFYRIVRDPGRTSVVVLDWKDNPTQNRGLFTLENNQPVAYDVARFGELNESFLNEWPELAVELYNRGYIDSWSEGKQLSPWYIYEALRPGADKELMAQEYDRNPEGSEAQFFNEARIEKRKKESARPPNRRGRIEIDDDYKVTFIDDENGPLQLWCNLDRHGKPLFSFPVIAGADISQGTAGDLSSNSVLAGFCSMTGEQIFEYATKREHPEKFAETAMAMGNWFAKDDRRVFLCWEHDGTVGKGYYKRINELHYGNIYMRDVQDVRGKKKSKKPGFLSQTDKSSILSDLRTAYYSGDIVIRSQFGHDELKMFIFDTSGNVGHSGAKTTEDLSARGKSHSDRPIAYGAAWLAMKDRPQRKKQLEKHPPAGSAAWRIRRRKQMRRAGTLIE